MCDNGSMKAPIRINLALAAAMGLMPSVATADAHSDIHRVMAAFFHEPASSSAACQAMLNNTGTNDNAALPAAFRCYSDLADAHASRDALAMPMLTVKVICAKRPNPSRCERYPTK